MDFTEPQVTIEGGYNRVLVVRDLGSGNTLSTLATGGEKAEDVRAELESLFQEHGAPLVLKSDNGSPLVAKGVQALLKSLQVVMMRSPAYVPSYNGSCERGLGWVKVRAEEFASADGRPGLLRPGDLERARRYQNSFGAPRGKRGVSPQSAWEARKQIGEEERALFIAEHSLALDREAEEEEKAENTSKRTRATIERAAVCRALCELNYLIIWRT
jgi:transposase InsO family protein